MVKISVIIPAYNVEEYIGKTITSIIKQDFKEIEIIVINDGSIDNTKKVIEDYLQYDNRIKLINTNNNGVSNARNIGLDNSTGKYVMFIDSDDWIEENALSKLWMFAEESNLDIVSFNCYKAYEDKIEIIKTNLNNEIITGEQAVKEVLINKMSPSVCDKMIKRDLFNSEFKFEKSIKMGEDLLMSVKLCASAERIGKLKDTYYYYYMRSDSVTHKVNEDIYSIVDSLKLIKEFLDEKGLYLNNCEEYEFLRFMHLYYYRVVVGDMDDKFHKDFFSKYKNYRSFENKYYKSLLRKSKIHVKIRVYLYKFSYPLGRFVHKNIKKLFK